MQQVNLLNPALIQKTALLNPNNIALLLGVLLLALVGYAAMEKNALSQLEQTKQQMAKQVETTGKQVDEMRTIQANKNDIATQLKQIEALEQKIAMQKEMITAIGLNKTGENPSYAEIFKAFSRQSVDGLWITGLRVTKNTTMLSIQGRTIDANLLPTFIANLRREPALKGKTFTDLTMQNVEKKLSANSQSANPQTAPTSALTNTKISNANTVATPANMTPMQTPPFMEFVLHSVMDKEVSDKNATLAAGEAKLGLVMQGAPH